MSSLNVDANGNRIKTDVLVSGYLRRCGNEFQLLIPDDITNVCFIFWFISVCDEWDKSMSHSLCIINNESIKLPREPEFSREGTNMVSAYGSHSVSSGSFEWKIRFKSKITWICIGVIKDEIKLLLDNQTKNNYGIFEDDGESCFLLNCNGTLYHHLGNNSHFTEEFVDEGTIITMALDVDKHTISYKINDTDYGVGCAKLSDKKYRLAVTLGDKDEIELL